MKSNTSDTLDVVKKRKRISSKKNKNESSSTTTTTTIKKKKKSSIKKRKQRISKNVMKGGASVLDDIKPAILTCFTNNTTKQNGTSISGIENVKLFLALIDKTIPKVKQYLTTKISDLFNIVSITYSNDTEKNTAIINIINEVLGGSFHYYSEDNELYKTNLPTGSDISVIISGISENITNLYKDRMKKNINFKSDDNKTKCSPPPSSFNDDFYICNEMGNHFNIHYYDTKTNTKYSYQLPDNGWCLYATYNLYYLLSSKHSEGTAKSIINSELYTLVTTQEFKKICSGNKCVDTENIPPPQVKGAGAGAAPAAATATAAAAAVSGAASPLPVASPPATPVAGLATPSAVATPPATPLPIVSPTKEEVAAALVLETGNIMDISEFKDPTFNNKVTEFLKNIIKNPDQVYEKKTLTELIKNTRDIITTLINKSNYLNPSKPKKAILKDNLSLIHI